MEILVILCTFSTTVIIHLIISKDRIEGVTGTI